MNELISQRNFIKSVTGALFVSFIPNIIVRAAAPVPHNPRVRTVVSGGSCPGTAPHANEDSDDNGTQTTFGAGNLRFGIAGWQNAGTVTICRIGFKIQGNGSAANFRVGVWTMSGFNLGSLVYESANIAGANWAARTWVEADTVAPTALSASTNYAILIYPTAAMGSNDILGALEGTGLSGYREVFDGAGNFNFGSGNDPVARVYYY
jgi:hypothetical protein